MRKQIGFLWVGLLMALLLMAACAPVGPGGAASTEPAAGEDTGLLGVIQERGKIVTVVSLIFHGELAKGKRASEV